MYESQWLTFLHDKVPGMKKLSLAAERSDAEGQSEHNQFSATASCSWNTNMADSQEER